MIMSTLLPQCRDDVASHNHKVLTIYTAITWLNVVPYDIKETWDIKKYIGLVRCVAGC